MIVSPGLSFGLVPTGSTLDSRTPLGVTIEWESAVGPFPATVGTAYTTGAPLVDFRNYSEHSTGAAMSYAGTPAPPTGLTLNSTGTVTGTATVPSQSSAMTVTATAGAVSAPKPVTITTQSAPVAGFVGDGGVSLVSGTLTDKSIITLSGTGFGAMNGDVLQFAYGDEGANLTAIHNKAVKVGTLKTYCINLNQDTTGQQLFFSTANPRPGRSASMRRVHFSRTTGNYNAGGFGWQGTPTRKLFMSYYRFSHIPVWVSATANHKQMYVNGDGNFNGQGGNPPSTPVIWPAQSTTWAAWANMGNVNGSGAAQNFKNDLSWNKANSTDVWQHWEVSMVMNATSGAYGDVQVWRDGALGIDSASDRPDWKWWTGAAPSPWNPIPSGWKEAFLGYMDKDMDDSYYDHSDWYIATTKARIVLGDAPIYADCTHREIQLIRESDWQNTQLKLTLNKGSFSGFPGTYLYRLSDTGAAVRLASFT